MIRILEVFGEPISRGGQESYVMNNLMHMDFSGIHVDLFTPYFCDNLNYQEFIHNNGGEILQGNMPFLVGGTRREIIPIFRDFISKNSYDIVHIHSGSISVLAYYAREAALSGTERVIVHSHSSGVKENLKHFLIKMYSAHIFRKYATDFFACSLEAAKWKYPKDVLPKVKVLKNGVDLDKFKFDENTRNRLREEHGINENTFVLGHVGRFTYEKNQIFLIEVLSEYFHHCKNKDAVLMLVGDGPERKNVEERARNLGVLDKVIFVGMKDNVSDYMQTFDVFLFPSMYEGLGIVGIEAQAVGLPVIASNGIPRAMKVTDAVCFLNLEDVPLWIKKIDFFIGKKDVKNNTTQQIRERGYDVNRTAKELLDIYTRKEDLH